MLCPALMSKENEWYGKVPKYLVHKMLLCCICFRAFIDKRRKGLNLSYPASRIWQAIPHLNGIRVPSDEAVRPFRLPKLLNVSGLSGNDAVRPCSTLFLGK